MKFYEYEDSTYLYAGTWCNSEDETPDGFDPEDCEIFNIEVDEYDEDVLEVMYYDCQEPKNSWSAYVRIDDGADWLVYDDEGYFMGRIPINGKGNETENFLLGLYDVIELWYNCIKVFYIND